MVNHGRQILENFMRVGHAGSTGQISRAITALSSDSKKMEVRPGTPMRRRNHDNFVIQN